MEGNIMRSKLIILVLALAAIDFATVVSSASQPVEAPIKMVTVFPDRAQISRIARLNLTAGEHALLIENLPMRADDASFRASASGVPGITILGLNHRVVQHLEAPQKKVAELEKQIKNLDRDVKQAIADRITAFQEQKKLLLAISETASQEMGEQIKKGGLDIAQWKAAYLFVGDRILEVNDSIRIAIHEQEDVDNQLDALNAQLRSLRDVSQRSSKTVQVDLQLENPGELELMLEYMTPGASWKPLYDARLDGESSEVDLGYYADVRQVTGEDWTDVELTLSTAMPSQGIGPGDFKPWYLSAVDIISIQDKRMTFSLEKSIKVVGERGEVDAVEIIPSPTGSAPADVAAASVYAGAYSTVFKVKRRESIPSGEQSVRTSIARWRLAGTVELISRPRNRQEVYRFVTVTNQDEAPLMPGEIAIFAESDFLGRTRLTDLIAPGESFELPFGQENKIDVKREILSYKKTRKTGKWRIDQTIKMTLTNNGRDSAMVQLEEPLPVSRDNRIKVKMGDVRPEPASTDAHGKATWTISLAAGEEKALLVPYRMEYPEGIQIAGL